MAAHETRRDDTMDVVIRFSLGLKRLSNVEVRGSVRSLD